MSAPLPRRTFLRLALSGVAGAAAVASLDACASGSSTEARSEPVHDSTSRPGGRRRILLAYFSRAGENYYYGGRRSLGVGNTEALARMISAQLPCDVHRIRAADPYSDDYDATVQRNVREQDADARPAIANPLVSIDRYDTILLASPIWNVRAPMIMATFTERYDFAGKTVHPVTTYAMSGLGTTPDDYAQSCRGARVAAGLAVRGEKVRSADRAISAWLSRTRLLDAAESARAGRGKR